MSLTETYAARKGQPSMPASWSKIELDDALRQINDVAVELAGELNGDPTPRVFDIEALRRQIVRLVWAHAQAKEHAHGIFERAMQLAGQVAEHEECDK